MFYTLNLHNVICKLYASKAGQKDFCPVEMTMLSREHYFKGYGCIPPYNIDPFCLKVRTT